jgi:hypothetical protein
MIPAKEYDTWIPSPAEIRELFSPNKSSFLEVNHNQKVDG